VEVEGLFFMSSPFLGGEMMNQKRLRMYTVNMKYIRNLHNQGDDRVFSVSPQTGKDNRPFVGIIVVCDDKQYCVPLSSPKEKHNNMKNSVDFYKIIDKDGKLIGVLDFNNMIPVRPDVVKEIDVRIHSKDNPQVKHYKNLVIDQINFCRQNQDIIVAKANKLYNMISKKNVSGPLKRRCLNWRKLENVLDRFKN
jgi:protein AbiQ